MLEPLLEKGYLPKELPPLFSSRIFASCMITNIGNLPKLITDAKPRWTSLSHHNIARIGGLRRRVSIPNPINYFRLANLFSQQSTLLGAKWSISRFSKTTPSLANARKRAISTSDLNRSHARAAARIGSRYILKADISQFYSSIYTHTIPWVVHGKAIAKSRSRDYSLIGNCIDRELQGSQQGQTKGVPIGPDTSLGIAELILSDIDDIISKKCKIIGGFRFIDDIEYSFLTLGDAERTLSVLEGCLHEYELQLNIKKTEIIQLPDYIESPYISQLRAYKLNSKKMTSSDWIDFFNTGYMLAKQNPTEGVLRYAVSLLRYTCPNKNSWILFQQLLWQCVSLDPGCIRFAIDVIINIASKDATLEMDKDIAQIAINSLIIASAPIGHGNEIVWSIWAALLFDVQLSDDAKNAIEDMDDPFVAIIAMIADTHGIFSGGVTSSRWADWFDDEDAFFGANWPFIYEAYRNNWFVEKVSSAKISENPMCEFLNLYNVSFIDERQISLYEPELPQTSYSEHVFY
jgi:hypothetical protein